MTKTLSMGLEAARLPKGRNFSRPTVDGMPGAGPGSHGGPARSGAGTPPGPSPFVQPQPPPGERHSQTPRLYRRSEIRKLVAPGGKGRAAARCHSAVASPIRGPRYLRNSTSQERTWTPLRVRRGASQAAGFALLRVGRTAGRKPGNTPTPPGEEALGKASPLRHPASSPHLRLQLRRRARRDQRSPLDTSEAQRRNSCPAEWPMSFRAPGHPRPPDPVLGASRLDAGEGLVDLDDLQRDTGLSREQVWAGLRALETAEPPYLIVDGRVVLAVSERAEGGAR